MATLNPSATITGGGGGDFRETDAPDHRGRLRRARLGLTVAITPIAMLFVSFTSAYIVRQGLPTFDERAGAYVRDWLMVKLPTSILLVNTIILVLSSISMELARRHAARQAALGPVRSIPGVSVGDERGFPWLGITVILGLGFLGGQWLAWGELAHRGFYLATSPSSSFVYLLTAAHAVHLAGGLLAMLYAAVISLGAPKRGFRGLGRRSVESRFIVIDTTAWYWHFMALLWIYIFALLQLAK